MTYNAAENTFSVVVGDKTVTLDLGNSEVEAILFELHAMLAVLTKSVEGASTPSVFSFTVSSLHGSAKLSAEERKAVAVVLARFVEKMTAIVNGAFNTNAITIVVSAPIAFAAASVHHVSARAVALGPNPTPPYTPDRNSRDYVEYCQASIHFLFGLYYGHPCV